MALSIVLLGSLSAFAEEEKVYTLSLEDAIELALKDNPELEVNSIKLSSADISLDAAKLAKRDYKNVPVTVSALSSAYVKNGYYVSLYESQIRLINLEREKIKSNIAYNVTEKYFNYKLMQRLAETTRQSYQLALDNKTSADESYRLGIISQLEAENAQIALEQSEHTLESYKRNEELAKEDLKIILQLDGTDCSFNLTDDIEFEDYESDVSTDVASAIETRYDTNALRESEALSKEYLDITAKYSPENTASYNSAKSDYIQNSYNMTNSTKQIGLMIKSGYSDILNTKGDLDIAQKNLNIQRQSYNASLLKYKMGMITNMKLTSELNTLSQCEIQSENAKLAYKLAVIKYKYNITIGL